MRYEGVNTSGVLEDVSKARANGTPDRIREAEVARVRAWWPAKTIDAACRWGAAWHAMTEPPRWDVDVLDVIDFIDEIIGRLGRWPTIDEQRRRFGHLPTDRLPGEAEGQEALPL